MSEGEFRQKVRPEWIDYNGHLSEAYYVLVFGFATDALMERTGMDEAYRTASGCSLYTVEAHVKYLREVGPDAEMLVRTSIVERGAKKLRIAHEMIVDGTVVATEEIVALHVDSAQGRSVPFPDHIAAQLDS
ncbi:thioesterase family protein [Saccharopolyspora sp. TS4A08]|uniref:Thioesterase family protein n=1 Tax=Saccharopolyspora ipomoeae TaxID=3042027 RepID=A0ABT6PY14_9PSEU|nr:thioesterase family protein [Saccharopolyspora sp. TS4A08]MDI2032752.1 thioesterase family protein [Saccharopolyspora sp. TS4A08]